MLRLPGPLDVAVVASHHRLLAGFEQPEVLGEKLAGAPALGVGVVPFDDEGPQPTLRVGDRLGDDSDTLLDRDDRGHAGLR